MSQIEFTETLPPSLHYFMQRLTASVAMTRSDLHEYQLHE